MSWPIVGLRPRKNLLFIRQDLKKHFIVALKSNRTVRLEPTRQSPRPLRAHRYARTGQTPTPVTAWIKGLPFPVLLHRQVFTNKGRFHRHFCIWPVVISTHTETPLRRSIKKDGKSKSFTKRSSPMPRWPSRRLNGSRTQSNHVLYGHLCGLLARVAAHQASNESVCPPIKTLSQGHSTRL